MLAATAVLACATPMAGAAVVAADTTTMAATAELAARLPAAQSFTVNAAGQVRITLTDLATPQAFTLLKLIVSRGGALVASLDAAGQKEFAATPGDYKVQVMGVPANGTPGPAGSFRWEARELAGNSVLKVFSDEISALPGPTSAQSLFESTVQFTQAGDYQLVLTDRSFPAALSSVNLLLNPRGGGSPVIVSGPCTTPCAPTAFNVAAPGVYDLAVAATAADPDKAGLYSLRIASVSGGDLRLATTQAVGQMPAGTGIALTGGGYTLSSTDLAFPVALSSLRLRLVQGAEQLAQLEAPGSSIALTATAGTAQLFALPRAASGGLGAWSVSLMQGARPAWRDVRTLPTGHDATLNAGGYSQAITVPATGTWRLRLSDLNFPSPFGQLRAVVVQNGSAVQSVSGTTIDTTLPLVQGQAFIAMIGSPAGSGANSLAGISLVPQAGGAALLDIAQPFGPLFMQRPLPIAAAGRYDLAISDLRFPAAFDDLAAAVTRGSQLVGQVFGGGTIALDAQPGDYAINLVARPNATAKFATWGFQLADPPPPPTVEFAANPASVASGGSTTLSWTSSDATSCVASGGWSGAHALSGTQPSGALTATSTFTLACTGPGGTTTRSATVTIDSGGGGGGAMDAWLLLALAALLCARQRCFSASSAARRMRSISN